MGGLPCVPPVGGLVKDELRRPPLLLILRLAADEIGCSEYNRETYARLTLLENL